MSGLESSFDPREWQLHAQTNGIYESLVKKKLGAKTFRSPDQRQLRLDAHYLMNNPSPETVRELRGLVSRAFGSTVGPGQKHSWVKAGTRSPSARSAGASLERYQGTYLGTDGKVRDFDDLVNTRQSYEEMLAICRDQFYRVTEEPTSSGNKYFVWPMVPGQRLPGPGLTTEQAAIRFAVRMSEQRDPRRTGKWHIPQCSYTHGELLSWLPPARVFRATNNPRHPGRSTMFWFWEETNQYGPGTR